MTVVVSDTSPIRALNHLGLLWLLERIFGVVYVPPAVAEELLHPRQGLVIDARGVSFFDVRAPIDPNRARALGNNLDPAEIEAISLAIELKAPFVLIDESAGRAAVEKAGMTPIGALSILVRAKRLRLIAEIKPLMDRLQVELNFYISSSLRDWVIRSAGEDRG